MLRGIFCRQVNPSVAFSDSSPFRGALNTPCASPERGGVREADGGVRRRRIREVQFMLPGFVFYPAEATGCRPCLPQLLRGNHSGFPAGEESGGSDLWPTDSCGPGGSRWLSALPTGGSKWVQAQPADRRRADSKCASKAAAAWRLTFRKGSSMSNAWNRPGYTSTVASTPARRRFST